MTRLVLAIKGIHCASCGVLIDDAVEGLPGVVRSRTDARTDLTTVDVEGSETTLEQIIGVITAEGFGASLVG